MSNLHIIGNGFDLSMGVKSSYGHFIKSKIFYDLLKDENTLAQRLNEKYQEARWVDIEMFLSKSMSTDGSWKNSFAEFRHLVRALREYLAQAEQDKEIRESPSITKYKRNYYTAGDIVYCFNYTSICKYTLSTKVNGGPNAEANVRMIHGSLADKNIIFGIHDGSCALDDHAFLFKSYNDNFSPGELNNNMKNSGNIIFYGHSLGECDSMYFNTFIETLASGFIGKRLIIHYYGESDKINYVNRLRNLCGSAGISKILRGNEITYIDASID